MGTLADDEVVGAQDELSSREAIEATCWRIVRAIHVRIIKRGGVPLETPAAENAALEPHLSQMEQDVRVLMHAVDAGRKQAVERVADILQNGPASVALGHAGVANIVEEVLRGVFDE
jgi:hypothetical protein